MLLLGVAIALLMAPVAQAWYVDISITGAGRVYETTDANELDEHCPAYAMEGFASPSTTPTGALGASCRAGDAASDYSSGWVVRYVAEAASGYRFDGWHSDGRTDPGPVLCDGSGGSSDYSGTACQFATFANLQVRARFVDDTAPAMSTLTGPNQVVNGPATFNFSAASDPTFRRFECRVPGVHDWTTCSSGHQENPSSGGNYTFEVRAVDWSGNLSGISPWGWTVDKLAPTTTLIDAPSGTVKSTSASFEFTSTESGSFVCVLDGVNTGCGSPKSYSGLSQGVHEFQVWAIDGAGNQDPTPVTRTWTVDTVAPATTISSGPGNGSSTTDTSATFVLDSETGATFRCQLDAGAITPCGSSVTYSGLSVGSHTVKVWATDAVGNEHASPATRTWTVTAPPAAGPTNSGTGTPPPSSTQPTTPLMVSLIGTTLDRTLPVLTRPAFGPSVFRVARGRTALTARARRGSKLRFTLSEAATVTIEIQRPKAGRRSKGKCRKPTRKLRRARRCTRWVKVGKTLTRRNLGAGKQVLPFSGRIGKKALKRGRYRAAITAKDGAGNTSKVSTAKFRIVR